MDDSNTHLASLLEKGEALSIKVSQTFGHLSTKQLNWKPNAKQWSIGQCLDHLIVTAAQYTPILNSIITLEKTQTWWERNSFLSGFLGQMLIKSLHPDAKRKIKTSSVFEPGNSEIPASIIADFASSQRQLLSLMEQTDGLNTSKIIITSPISKVVTYSLKDAMTILTVHGARHVQQAERLMEHASFPSE